MSNREAGAGSGAPALRLSAGDLPAYCPNPAMPLWSSHPRVFLEVVNDTQALCPYCGTRYRLQGSRPIEGGPFDSHHLHQHREAPDLKPLEGPGDSTALHRPFRETPVLAADALGNTTLALMTRWLRLRT